MMLFAFYVGSSSLRHVPADAARLAGVVTGLTLYNGAVVAELVRAGVNSLPKGQTRGGAGDRPDQDQTMRLILLPQAITAMLPAMVSQLVVILKDTALGYIITYEELLRKAEQIGNYKANLIPALIVVAAIFVIMNYLLA